MRIMYITLIIATMALLFSISAVAETKVPAEIVFKSKIKSMEKADVGPVLYPHKLHEALYECGDCHPAIFKDKIGANDVNMQENIDGKYCGAAGCHNSAKAFPLYYCESCHTDVKGASK